MKNKMKKLLMIVPGFAVSVLIAIIARFIEGLIPIHIIGASVIAMFIGMGINLIKHPNELMSKGIKFTSKKVLKFAIILLGASLDITTVLKVGKNSLFLMIFTLATCFGLGYVSGRIFKLNWKMSNLISAGTGICGGSAIAAIAPVIEADDIDIAFGMSATFIFDMIMVVVFPILGRAMGLSDIMYGLWTGTAVNDTSSVVAAGFAYSEAAGDYATMVKLTRTLTIIPTVIIFAFVNMNLKKKQKLVDGSEKINVNISSIFPWFILGFVAMSVLKSFGVIPVEVSKVMKDISKFLMVASLAAIGINTSFKDMKKVGPAPMIHGFVISLLVVLVSIGVIFLERQIGML